MRKIAIDVSKLTAMLIAIIKMPSDYGDEMLKIWAEEKLIELSLWDGGDE